MASPQLSIEQVQTYLRKLVRREAVDRIVSIGTWVLTLVVVALATATGVQVINTYFATKAEKLRLQNEITSLAQSDKSNVTKDKKPDYSVIVQKNVFGPLGPKNPVSNNAKPQTKLPLILIGVFLEQGESPYAIIEDDKKKVQDVFMVNDMVFGESKLVAVHSDRVELNRAGQIEVLALDDAPDARGGGGSTGAAGEDIVVNEQELNEALANLPLLLTQARAVPYFKDGKAVGLRLFAIKGGSLYEKVGLQNGDILKSINGSSLSDITQAMKLFETLKAERSIEVVLERNREEKGMRYQIK